MSFRFSAIQGAMTSHSRSYGEDLQRSKVLKLGVRKSNKTYGQLLKYAFFEILLWTLFCGRQKKIR